MAKASIITTDSPDGSVFLQVVFDPPVGEDEEGTPAQQLAASLVAELVLDNDTLSKKFEEGAN